MPDLSPTQTAYDRIQRAGTRSPMTMGNISIVYELCNEGIRIDGRTPSMRCSKIVSWHDLAFSKADPLKQRHDLVVASLTDDPGGN